MLSRRFSSSFVLLIALLGIPLSGFAQATFTAAIRGVVTDSSGALVSGGEATIINQATSEAKTVKTDTQGRYSFNNLRPATYTLRVEANGFKTEERRGITLRVAQQPISIYPCRWVRFPALSK